MVSPSGTYDALAFPVALPKSVVNAMLPDWLKDQFHPIPDEVFNTFSLDRRSDTGEDTHIIVVQLGYQKNTGVGPAIMRMFSFHEAKIDVPYLKHYHRRHIGADDVPFAYKQVIFFSLRMMQLGGLAIPGSRSILGRFGPDQTPFSYEAGAPQIEYRIEDTLEAEFSRVDSLAEIDQGQAWTELRKLLTMPWFGARTGKTAVEFDFQWDGENALAPTAYDVTTSLTPAFLGLDAAKFEPIKVTAKAWRYKASYQGLEKAAPTY